MTITTSQLKLFLALIGFWFVLSCSALYGLGRSHGRALLDCQEPEALYQETKHLLSECRSDIEDVRVSTITSEAERCQAVVDQYKALRCKICEGAK